MIEPFQYEIGKTYQIVPTENHSEVWLKGFSFCQVPIDVCIQYGEENCRYAEIEASGKIIERDYRCACSKITIIRELSTKQIKELTSGPFIRCDKSKFFYLNGQLHRVDGPAIEWSKGIKEWYLSGLSETSFGWSSN
jgi:hypothetical protein